VDGSERRIEAQVEDAFEKDAALRGILHVVDVQRGAVFLESRSASFLSQLRAIDAAARVPGVHEVRMRLDGRDEPREDELTRIVVGDTPRSWTDVHPTRDDASSETELGHPEPIRVTPEMAVAADQAIAVVARGMTRFVRDVRDAWITTATETALLIAPKVHARQLAVHTTDGVVTLSGTVPSRKAEKKAVRVAGDVSGVRRVDDALVIASTPRHLPATG
jgi:hyperosmotically inducible protein